MSEKYAYRREFLSRLTDDKEISTNDILCKYSENVTDTCRKTIGEYYGFGTGSNFVLFHLRCMKLSVIEWRWCLYVQERSTLNVMMYFFDSIYNPESLCVVSYDSQKPEEFLRPHELDDTPLDVVSKLEKGIVPIFNWKAYPQITGIRFYHSIPRTEEMCMKVLDELYHHTENHLIIRVSQDTTRISTDAPEGKVLYTKDYVVPFCELCFENESLVQLAGSGYTLCHFCLHNEIKKGVQVFPGMCAQPPHI